MFTPSKRWRGGAYNFDLDILALNPVITSVKNSNLISTSITTQNEFDLSEISTYQARTADISMNILTDKAQLPTLNYIRGSTFASYQTKHIINSTVQKFLSFLILNYHKLHLYHQILV